MLQDMNQSEFGQFVAALWERQGWQTQIKQDDGRTFIALQRPETGEEGLLWAIADGEVGGQQVQQFQSLCEQYEVTDGAIVTGGTISDHAEKAASGSGLDLLDGEAIAAILKKKGLTDLVDQFAGSGGQGNSGSGESPLDQLKPIVSRAATVASGVPVQKIPLRGVAVAVVVVVALVGAGVLFGGSIPFLGGDGGDGVSAESTSPDGANASLHVAWNAKVTDVVDPNESDGVAYHAPKGERFVLVRMSVNNTGNGTVPLAQTDFKLRANGTTYSNETLANHRGFVNFDIGPGTNYVGWTVFSIPKGESATLMYDQNATDVAVAVEFERDSSLAINVTRL